MEIGSVHEVTCVRFLKSEGSGVFGTQWWPTIGPRHEDKKYIGFARNHYHIDHRFCTDAQIDKLKLPPFWGAPESTRITSKVMCVDSNEFKDLPHEVKVRRIRCKRKPIHFPQSSISEKVKAGFEGCALKNAGICPHKGFPLEPLPEDERFALCPGHGLLWNLTEKRLATTEEETRINGLIGRDCILKSKEGSR